MQYWKNWKLPTTTRNTNSLYSLNNRQFLNQALIYRFEGNQVSATELRTQIYVAINFFANPRYFPLLSLRLLREASINMFFMIVHILQSCLQIFDFSKRWMETFRVDILIAESNNQTQKHKYPTALDNFCHDFRSSLVYQL